MKIVLFRSFLWLAFLLATTSGQKTNALPQAEKTIVVALDGSGQFTSVREAIEACPDNSKTSTVIFIRKGIYKEKIDIPASKINLVLIGEEVNSTIITNDDFASKKRPDGKEFGTGGSTSVYIRCGRFRAENITFENSSGPVGQAVAVSVAGDQVFFRNCRFLGFQDTLYTSGNTTRQYFYNCYIEGTVDFIFGASTALFDQCELYCKRGGYITAASTPAGQPYGYVFSKCTVTGNAPNNSFYLGRPWRPNAHVVFLECSLSAVIRKEGWNNWGNAANEQTALYREYNNQGKGADTTGRVQWSHQLSKDQAKLYSRKKLFSNWTPEKMNKVNIRIKNNNTSNEAIK